MECHRCKDESGRTSSVQGLFGERRRLKDEFGGTLSEEGFREEPQSSNVKEQYRQEYSTGGSRRE